MSIRYLDKQDIEAVSLEVWCSAIFKSKEHLKYFVELLADQYVKANGGTFKAHKDVYAALNDTYKKSFKRALGIWTE